MAMWAVFFIVFIAEVTQPEVLNQKEPQWKSIALATINSYDIDKPYNENFFAILYSICPNSVHCDGRNATDLDFSHIEEHFNDTFELSKGMIQEKNATLIDEARRYLESSFSNMQRCCKKCFCKEDCKLRNTCCALTDADETLNSHSSMRETQHCIFPSVYPGYTDSVGKSFYMISDCSNGSIADDVIRKCQNPKQEILSEVIPVYSATANSLYRNKYCAVCNDEFMWISWQLKVYFTDIVTLTKLEHFLNSQNTPYQQLRQDKRAIKLSMEPNDEFLKRKDEFICSRPESMFYVDSMCTELTTLNEDQKYFLQFACSNYLSTYNYKYRNVFCYICDMMLRYTRVMDCDDTMFRNAANSFSGLLYSDRDTEIEKVVATQNNSCTCREYFDKSQDSCRPVICPLGKIYFSCTCESILENITGLALRVGLDIVPETPTIDVVKLMNETTTDKLVRNVKTTVNTFFKTKWGPMEIRLIFMNRETLLSDRSHIKFHVIFFMRSKQLTDNMVLWKDVHDLLHSKVRISFLKNPMLMYLGKIINVYDFTQRSFVVDYESAYSTDYTFETLFSSKSNSDGLAHYQLFETNYLTKLLFCKRTTLSDEEVLRLTNSSITVSYTEEEISQMFDASEQKICFDDFVTIFKTPKSNACGHCPNQQLVFCFVVWLSSLLIYI